MAERTTIAPDSARNVDHERPKEGEEALRAALESYGGEFADAVEYTDELEDILETAVLVIASAEDEEVDYVTDAVVTLMQAAEAVSSEGLVKLAEEVGKNSEDLADALESVLELQKNGQLDDLLEMASLFATLEIDETTVIALNRVVGAVSEAEKETEPVGVVGFLRSLFDTNVRESMGYLLAILRALGNRLPK